MGPPARFERAAMLRRSVGLQIDAVYLGGSTQMVHAFCELPQLQRRAGGDHEQKRLKGTQWTGRRARRDIRRRFSALLGQDGSPGAERLQGAPTVALDLTPP